MAVRTTYWQPKQQNLEEPHYVVTKEEFLSVLARMQLQLKDEKKAPPQEVAPRTAPTQDFSPPPGLSRPEWMEQERTSSESAGIADSTSEEEKEPHQLPKQTDGYQVLVRDLPEMMATEPMMRVILEQANLDMDVLGMDFRAGGKVLIKFLTLESVKICVQHFNGRPWGNKGNCVSALYVRTVSRVAQSKTAAPQPATQRQERATFQSFDLNLSAKAPVFIPNPASTLSAAANVFVPSCPSKKEARSRFHSDASTSASAALSSDDCELSGSEGGICRETS
jgi:hypothetical protein